MPNNILVLNPGFTYDDLAEKVEDISPETASLSWEDGDARLVYNDIPGDCLIDALMLIEGYCWTELSVVGHTMLRRKNAMVHPKFPWMRANKIESVEGYGGASAKVLTLGNFNTDGNDVSSATNLWDKYRIAVSFNTPEYDVMTDGELDLLAAGNERLRYCYISGTETSTSAISVQGGQIRFKGGQGNIGANNELNAPSHSIYESIQTIKVVWTKVSEDYLQAVNPGDPLGGGFYKLNNGLSCVNSQVFLGRRPGTMLMDPYAYRRKRLPVRTTDGTTPFWGEIEFTFRFFDPTPGAGVTAGWPGFPASRVYGWNLAPTQSRQYLIVEIPTLGETLPSPTTWWPYTGWPIYNYYDFNNLFFPPEV